MQYTITINIQDMDVEDITKVMSEKYWYTDMVKDTEDVIIPAVLNQDDVIIEAERIEKREIEIPNPLTLLEHMWIRISEDIKNSVLLDRTKSITEQAILAIDKTTITPVMDITIT